MRKGWSADEDFYLRNHYGKFAVAKLAQHLQRSRTSVIGRAFRLGLSEPTNVSKPPSASPASARTITLPKLSLPEVTE